MKKFTNQLTMLSRLRNLQNATIKKIKVMSNIEYNIEEDIAYIEGVEVGEERGEKKGIEKGEKKGEIKKSIIGIQSMTVAKLDEKQIANFLVTDLNFVLDIQKQLLKTDKINALLRKKETIETIAKKLRVNPILVEILQENMNKKTK
jgi:predicted transposase YdaD